MREVNELGFTRYGDSGIVIENKKRKVAAEKALAAIKETLSDIQISYGIVEDILQIAKDIAYFRPLQ